MAGRSRTPASANIRLGGSTTKFLNENGSYSTPAGGGGGGSAGYASSSSTFSTTSSIPIDDTIPQNTEGTELITVDITPTSASSKVQLTVDFWYAGDADKYMTVAFFTDTTANAWAATIQRINTSTGADHFSFSAAIALGDTSAHTLKVRVGISGTTLYINQTTSSAHLHGSTGNVTLAAVEVGAS